MHVSVTRTIAASPSTVWELIANHEGWASWFPAVRRVSVTGSGEGVGGSRTVLAAGMRFEETFTAWEPGQLFAFTVVRVRPPFVASMAESVRLVDDGDATVVTYQQGVEPRPGFAWLWRRARSKLEAGLTEGMDGLAATAERTSEH